MMNERNLKDLLYGEFARVGKSISSPKRLEIIDLLSQGPKSVDALSKATTMSIANVSQHLQTLLNSNMVKYTKKGNFVIYEIADEIISEFLASLHKLSERQSVQVQHIKQEFLNSHLGLEGVTLAELKNKMDKGEVLLIDVRPTEEYIELHIPGAISIPVEELADKISTLPANYDVVAYCRGPYCLMSAEAVKLLKSVGMNAFRLEESVHDWLQFEGNIS